jgi:hypothetical protein
MDVDTQNRFETVGHLKDILVGVDSRSQPFLYNLPDLLFKTDLSQLNPNHAVMFSELALHHDKQPIVKDALAILNQLIDPIDGTLVKVSPACFYGNRSFFWDELGGHTDTSDVILHVFNKTIFTTNLGKSNY